MDPYFCELPLTTKRWARWEALGAGTAENFVTLAAAPPFYLWPGYCSQSLGDVLGSPELQDFLNQTTLKTGCISDLENQVSPQALGLDKFGAHHSKKENRGTAKCSSTSFLSWRSALVISDLEVLSMYIRGLFFGFERTYLCPMTTLDIRVACPGPGQSSIGVQPSAVETQADVFALGGFIGGNESSGLYLGTCKLSTTVEDSIPQFPTQRRK